MLKGVLKAIMGRMNEKKINNESAEQFGCIEDKGTTNAIFILRMPCGGTTEMQRFILMFYWSWRKKHSTEWNMKS